MGGDSPVQFDKPKQGSVESPFKSTVSTDSTLESPKTKKTERSEKTEKTDDSQITSSKIESYNAKKDKVFTDTDNKKGGGQEQDHHDKPDSGSHFLDALRDIVKSFLDFFKPKTEPLVQTPPPVVQQVVPPVVPPPTPPIVPPVQNTSQGTTAPTISSTDATKNPLQALTSQNQATIVADVSKKSSTTDVVAVLGVTTAQTEKAKDTTTVAQTHTGGSTATVAPVDQKVVNPVIAASQEITGTKINVNNSEKLLAQLSEPPTQKTPTVQATIALTDAQVTSKPEHLA